MRRILTIDGGGIRGVFPAAFLAHLAEDLEYPVHRYFDLIAGTSTGGIIAIGLAMGVPARRIMEMYETHGPEIFGLTRSDMVGRLQRKVRKFTWCFCGPKYDSGPLRNALHETLSDKRIGDAQTRLVIPAWSQSTQSVYLFKTAHHRRLMTDYKSLAIDAAMATAAAPGYFEEHLTADDVGLVDGGMWANNPVGVAVVEAIGMLGWPARDIKVLSISCLDEVKRYRKRYGAVGLAKNVAGFFLSGQSRGSMGIAQILTGDPHERQAIFRISQPFPEGQHALDSIESIEDLKDRAFTEARTQKPILQREFFTDPAEEFQPEYRCNNDH